MIPRHEVLEDQRRRVGRQHIQQWGDEDTHRVTRVELLLHVSHHVKVFVCSLNTERGKVISPLCWGVQGPPDGRETCDSTWPPACLSTAGGSSSPSLQSGRELNLA